MKALTLAFNNNPIHISRDAWFNATDMTRAFNKRPADWLKQKETKGYIALLCKRYKVTENHFIKTQKGKGRAGTWLHRKLAIRFAQWLSAEFAIWCDEVIEEIISGSWQQERDASKAYYRMMTDTLQQSRLDQGKDTKTHHFTNEARLINYALTGDYSGINRDNADKRTLSAIKALESYNSVLIMQGLPYDERKAKLCEYAIKYRTPLIEVAL